MPTCKTHLATYQTVRTIIAAVLLVLAAGLTHAATAKAMPNPSAGPQPASALALSGPAASAQAGQVTIDFNNVSAGYVGQAYTGSQEDGYTMSAPSGVRKVIPIVGRAPFSGTYLLEAAPSTMARSPSPRMRARISSSTAWTLVAVPVRATPKVIYPSRVILAALAAPWWARMSILS